VRGEEENINHLKVGKQTMSTREKLSEIVGAKNFSDDPEVLKSYFSDFSLEPSGAASYLVKPKDAQEVQNVIKFAN
jgi:FAD/FMN-containing dehydrogenase